MLAHACPRERRWARNCAVAGMGAFGWACGSQGNRCSGSYILVARWQKLLLYDLCSIICVCLMSPSVSQRPPPHGPRMGPIPGPIWGPNGAPYGAHMGPMGPWPGSTQDRSKIDPGSILNRSRIDPGSTLDCSMGPPGAPWSALFAKITLLPDRKERLFCKHRYHT